MQHADQSEMAGGFVQQLLLLLDSRLSDGYILHGAVGGIGACSLGHSRRELEAGSIFNLI